MASIRAYAETLSVPRLRDEISERSERIRVEQAAVAELSAVLVERERVAAIASGRSEAAARLGATRDLQKLAGITRFEARSLVDVGTAMAPENDTPWMHPVADATRDGAVSVTKAQVIGIGLGAPNERVSPEDLLLATQHLVEVAPDLTPEQLERETRAVREQLDHQRVIDEERRIQDERSVRFRVLRDGSSTLFARFDREATQEVSQFVDSVIGPRSGGPRFTTDEGKAYQERINNDPRSSEQLLHDVLVMVVRAGLAVNPNRLPAKRPAVRVIVTAKDLAERSGYGELEGTGQTVSIQTVERIACDTGTVEIEVDGQGKPLNHGQEKRFFTDAQRTALAIRDGGCRRAICDRKSWESEAHHMQHYADGGPTTIDNGILLCKTDHLDLHNSNSWIEYERDREMYVWCYPDGRREDMPSKSRIQERIAANGLSSSSPAA